MTAAQIKAVEAAEALEDEALEPVDDGSITVLLVTEDGEADITVPPLHRWRSKARHALLTIGDDYMWAEATLSREDFAKWDDLDPTTGDVEAFVDRWTEAGGQDSGKVASLAAFIEAHSEALEADLARYYRTDLRDWWQPGHGPSRLTPRRLRVLIDHLPPESATRTALRNSLSEAELDAAAKRAEQHGHGPWSHLDHLVAHLSDQIGWLTYTLAMLNGGKPDKPKPLPRPGVRTGPARAPLTNAAIELLGSLGSREEA